VLASGVANTSAAARTSAMRYCLEHQEHHFHLHGSGARDTEGQEFADDAAAIQEARIVARDLSQNRNPSSRERVVVTNEKGDVIHEEPLFRR
jgi:hypothetical protein